MHRMSKLHQYLYFKHLIHIYVDEIHTTSRAYTSPAQAPPIYILQIVLSRFQALPVFILQIFLSRFMWQKLQGIQLSPSYVLIAVYIGYCVSSRCYIESMIMRFSPSRKLLFSILKTFGVVFSEILWNFLLKKFFIFVI